MGLHGHLVLLQQHLQLGAGPLPRGRRPRIKNIVMPATISLVVGSADAGAVGVRVLSA